MPVKPKRKGINGKQKGNRNERWFAKELNKRFETEEFMRVPQSGAWATNNKGKGARDGAIEILSGDLIAPENFIFSIECKSRQDFNFWDMLADETENEIDSWIEQASTDAKLSNKEPLLLIKINNRKPFAMFPVKIKETNLKYKNFSILRFDYFLQLEDKFFFKE